MFSLYYLHSQLYVMCFESIFQPLKPLGEKGFSLAFAVLRCLIFHVFIYRFFICCQRLLTIKVARQCSEFSAVTIHDSDVSEI